MEIANNTNKMWTMLLHLGTNMWSKPGCAEYSETLLCEMDCWEKVTSFLPECGINTLLIDIGEGIIFDSHPELAIEGSLPKDTFKKELERLRSIGITPLPKFNFSSGHSGWAKQYANMIGSPVYSKLCRDLIEETIDLFDRPEFFHLGMEEETAEDQANFPIAAVRSPYKLIDDANDLFETCRKNGVRPWMWADPHLVETFGGEKDFTGNVPKDVLLSNWYYGFVSPDYKNSEALFSHSGRIGVYNKLDHWGYEQVPACSALIDPRNMDQTMRYCKDTFEHPENLRGFVSAPWCFTLREFYYSLCHEAWSFGLAKKAVFPECK